MTSIEESKGKMFGGVDRGKKVLVTGHAGFKGSWLCLWLEQLGAEVIGYGRPARTEPNHYTLLGNVSPRAIGYGGDIWSWEAMDLLNKGFLKATMEFYQPDLIIHLAAKAIVARTFQEPRETFENNVMGMVNVLEAARLCPSVKGVVAITTDKIYEDRNWQWGYRENDEMGGDIPYDASKVCVEHVIRCYRESYGMHIATARAGNVIGGGDWSEKRLIPDIVRAAAKGEKVVVHTPTSTRPWQQVLDPLCGYLMLGKAILEGRNVNSAWNFGPDGDSMSVLDILKTAKRFWDKIDWEVDDTPTHPKMVYLLRIDNTKAKEKLGWRPVIDMKTAVKNTIEWYRSYYEHGLINSRADIIDYQCRAAEKGVK
jgi:CDP-glucose 4,6-dehydratase